MAKTVTVTSGKGGVGKTNLCANLAMQLAIQDYRTCIFDADLGLANINILFGMYPEKTIEDVLLQGVPLSDVIKNYHGIDIIPGSSGVENIANLDSNTIECLIKSFSLLDAYDYVLFDTSAGVSKNVVAFCLASSEIIIVITPEPTSLTDAYALLKILCLNGLQCPVKVVVNHCKDTKIAKQTYMRFKEVTIKYLSIDIQPLGVIIEDPKISDSVRHQQPFITLYPDTIASKCIRSIANNFLQHKADTFAALPVATFWKHFIGIVKGQLNLKGVIDDKKEIQPETPKQAAPAEYSEEIMPGHTATLSTTPGSEKPAEPLISAEMPETEQMSAPSLSIEDIKSEEAPEQALSALPLPQSDSKPEHMPASSAYALQPETETVSQSEISGFSFGKSQQGQPVQSIQEPPETSAEPSLPEDIQPLSEPQTAANLLSATDLNLHSLLNKLVTSMAIISDEFPLLRKAIEDNGKPCYGTDALVNNTFFSSKQEKPILLEFEKFTKIKAGKQ